MAKVPVHCKRFSEMEMRWNLLSLWPKQRDTLVYEVPAKKALNCTETKMPGEMSNSVRLPRNNIPKPNILWPPLKSIYLKEHWERSWFAHKLFIKARYVLGAFFFRLSIFISVAFAVSIPIYEICYEIMARWRFLSPTVSTLDRNTFENLGEQFNAIPSCYNT